MTNNKSNDQEEPITTTSATSLPSQDNQQQQQQLQQQEDDHSSASSFGITSKPTQIFQTPNKEMRHSVQHPAALALKPEKEMSPFISDKNPLKTLFHSQQGQGALQPEGNTTGGGSGDRKGKFKAQGYSVDDMMI